MHRASAIASHVLIYDGDCAFCSLWVTRLRQWLPLFPSVVTSQSINPDDYALSDDDLAHYAWYITEHHQYAGHLAASALLRAQPRFALRLLGHLIATPPLSLLAALTYSFISRFRHRLPGGTASCEPTLVK